MRPIRLFNIYGFTGMNYAGNVWGINGLSLALLTMTGGNRQPLIIEIKEGEMSKTTWSKNKKRRFELLHK